MSLILHATHRSFSKCYAKNLIESSLSDQMGNGSSSPTTELKVKTADLQGLLRTASAPHFVTTQKPLYFIHSKFPLLASSSSHLTPVTLERGQVELLKKDKGP